MSNEVIIGRDRFPVADLNEAVSCWEAARDQNNWGASDAPRCIAVINGAKFRIAYNGRTTPMPTVAQQARMFGGTVEQARTIHRKNAQQLIRLAADARILEATGKTHRSGVARQLEDDAFHAFAMADGEII